MITIVYIILALTEAAFASQTNTVYHDKVKSLCDQSQYKDKCEDDFRATGSEWSVALQINALRLSIIAINGLVILVTWFNQCFKGFTILSLPWSQLAYAFISAIAMFDYTIADRAFDESGEQELYDSIKSAGPTAIIQALLAFCVSFVNTTLIRRVRAGEPV